MFFIFFILKVMFLTSMIKMTIALHVVEYGICICPEELLKRTSCDRELDILTLMLKSEASILCPKVRQCSKFGENPSIIFQDTDTVLCSRRRHERTNGQKNTDRCIKNHV